MSGPEALTSPLIRLSEVLSELIPEQKVPEYVSRLECLARDGELALHGQHVWIIDENHEQHSNWQVVSPVKLSSARWNWSADEIHLDENERVDFGVNPQGFRCVSFLRTELFDWFDRSPRPPIVSEKKRRGRPSEFDWKKIASIARAVAGTGPFSSENSFRGALVERLDQEGIPSPSMTRLKEHQELSLIAKNAKASGQK